MAPPYWKSDAICLRLVEYSNTSLIATFLTRERGRMSAIAKGARRPGSAFYGELEVLTRAEIVCIPRKTALATLTEARVVDTWRPARHDLARLHAALYVLELVREGTVENEPCPRLFDLACRALERIAYNPHLNPLTVAIFEMLALEEMGLGPRLEGCAECERPLDDDDPLVWAPILGGLGCAACAAADRDRRPLSKEALVALRALARGPDAAAPPLRLAPHVLREVRGHLDAWVACRLERRLKLAPFIATDLGA